MDLEEDEDIDDFCYGLDKDVNIIKQNQQQIQKSLDNANLKKDYKPIKLDFANKIQQKQQERKDIEIEDGIAQKNDTQKNQIIQKKKQMFDEEENDEDIDETFIKRQNDLRSQYQQDILEESDIKQNDYQNQNQNQKQDQLQFEDEELQQQNYSQDQENLENVNFKQYFENLQKRKSDIPIKILNRRYKKLQELIYKDEFFSEEEIKLREPLLYYLYCGQYIRNGNIQIEDTSKEGLFKFLMERNVEAEYKKILEKQYKLLINKKGFPELHKNEYINQEDMDDNQDELIRLLHDRFICGYEKEHFNYELIDDNEQYDDEKEIDNDEEENYFDNQNSLEINPENSEYTGIQDY